MRTYAGDPSPRHTHKLVSCMSGVLRFDPHIVEALPFHSEGSTSRSCDRSLRGAHASPGARPVHGVKETSTSLT